MPNTTDFAAFMEEAKEAITKQATEQNKQIEWYLENTNTGYQIVIKLNERPLGNG